jgi:hypothetical protein
MNDRADFTNPAIIAAIVSGIQTTQSDHERRISSVETALTKEREFSDIKFANISTRIDDIASRITDKIDEKIQEIYRWVEQKNREQGQTLRWVVGFTITAIITGLCTLAAVIGSWVTRVHP